MTMLGLESSVKDILINNIQQEHQIYYWISRLFSLKNQTFWLLIIFSYINYVN